MNKTPGISSAMPWSMYLLTTLLISRRSLSLKGIILNRQRERENQILSFSKILSISLNSFGQD